MNAEDRRRRARLGALAVQARYDGRELTAAARRGFLARFENEVDPDRILPAGERVRRAEAAKRAYFLRLAMRSAAARRQRSRQE